MAFVVLNFLKERRPRRDSVSQTTTHRPEGGAPTGDKHMAFVVLNFFL
jgi:hypothetical protein